MSKTHSFHFIVLFLFIAVGLSAQVQVKVFPSKETPRPESRGVEKLTLSAASLAKATTIYDLIGTSPKCKIIQFSVGSNSKKPGPGNTRYLLNRGEIIDEKVKKYLSTLEVGKIIRLNGVQSAGNCLRYQRNGNQSFSITIE